MKVVLKSLSGIRSENLYTGLGRGTSSATQRLCLKKCIVSNVANVESTVDLILTSINKTDNVTYRKFIAKDVIIPGGTVVNLICDEMFVTNEYSVVLRLTDTDDSVDVYFEYDLVDDATFVSDFNVNF